jgi:hypothetical protein
VYTIEWHVVSMCPRWPIEINVFFFREPHDGN